MLLKSKQETIDVESIVNESPSQQKIEKEET